MTTTEPTYRKMASGFHLWTCQGNDLYSVDDLKRCNRYAGQHFFDADTMRFFKSRVSDSLYSGPSGVFFVTSEKGPNNVRGYTVRQFDCQNASVDTVGPFNELSRSTAHRLAKACAELGTLTATVRVLGFAVTEPIP